MTSGDHLREDFRMKDLAETITVREAAETLGLSVQQVHRLADAGTLEVVHQLPGATGAKLLDRSSVDRFLAERAS